MLSPAHFLLGDRANSDRANTLAAVQENAEIQGSFDCSNTLVAGQCSGAAQSASARDNTLTPGQRPHDHQHKCAGVFPKEGK